MASVEDKRNDKGNENMRIRETIRETRTA